EVSRVAAGKSIAICHLAADRLVPLHGGAPRDLAWLRGRRVLGVAALASPAPFFEALRGTGALVEEDAFADHHPFHASDAARIQATAEGHPIVMTHKDAVKLRPLLPSSTEAFVLEQAVRIESGGDALDAALRRALAG
ncbi:MAG TPA: tetraacyldisaccharide 4'-kinase, partial [Longimicrobiaceae bacterium]|nr:tetraacyldisaccharide 4'-kinase [Longimicrobiaceae bacterium]